MALILVEAPQWRFVERAAVKRNLHVTTDADDDRIDQLILAAESFLDGGRGILGRALVHQTWKLTLPDWPEEIIRLPLPPLISVESITYLDSTGDEQTLDSSLYRVVDGGAGGHSGVMREFSATWPSVYSGVPDGVRVTYTCGYQDELSPSNNPVPEAIVRAALLLISSWYDDPNAEPSGAFWSLVTPFMVRRLGARCED